VKPTLPPPPPPAELAWIADVVGPEATLALVKAFGGTRLYISSTVQPDGEFAQAIGVSAAQAAARAWGGDRPRIPLARPWLARCLQAEGRTNREIARELRVAETSVPDLLYGRRQSRDNRDVRGLPPAPLQLDMFSDPKRGPPRRS